MLLAMLKRDFATGEACEARGQPRGFGRALRAGDGLSGAAATPHNRRDFISSPGIARARNYASAALARDRRMNPRRFPAACIPQPKRWFADSGSGDISRRFFARVSFTDDRLIGACGIADLFIAIAARVFRSHRSPRTGAYAQRDQRSFECLAPCFGGRGYRKCRDRREAPFAQRLALRLASALPISTLLSASRSFDACSQTGHRPVRTLCLRK